MYTTRTTLLQKIADCDQISWQEFYDCYHGLVRSVALKSGVPAADTDDIVQNVMLGVCNRGNFLYSREKHGLFRTYLGGIIRHKIGDYFRRNVSPPSDLCVAEDTDFENTYLDEYRCHIMELAISELREYVAPEVFETFELCFLRSLPDKEVAALTGVKPNTVTVRKQRCIEYLQKIIRRINQYDPDLKLPPL